MENDVKMFLVGIAALYQFADITSTNKAISLGLSEDNKFIKKVMEVLDNLWWLVKIAPMWIAFWLVWDEKAGLIAVTAASVVFYHWVVFENNLPAIKKWKERRKKNKRGSV